MKRAERRATLQNLQGWRRGLAGLARTVLLVIAVLVALASAALLVASIVIWFFGGL